MDLLIPDYSGAYIQRILDVRELISSQRKVYAMCTGGIAIECLLSDIVAKYFGVTNRTTNLRKWIPTKNLNSRHVKYDSVKYYIMVPDKHFFQSWLVLADEFLKLSPKVISAINIIQRPLNNDTYIELRYAAIDQINTEFDEWKQAYNLVKTWLEIQRANM